MTHHVNVMIDNFVLKSTDSSAGGGRERGASFTLYLIDFGRSRVLQRSHNNTPTASSTPTTRAVASSREADKTDLGSTTNTTFAETSQRIFDFMTTNSLCLKSSESPREGEGEGRDNNNGSSSRRSTGARTASNGNSSRSSGSSSNSGNHDICFYGLDLWTFKINHPLMLQQLTAYAWTYEADYLGVANCIHELLFYEEMQITTINNNNNNTTTTSINTTTTTTNTKGIMNSSSGVECTTAAAMSPPLSFVPQCAFKRYWKKDLWREVFHKLLNHHNHNNSNNNKEEDLKASDRDTNTFTDTNTATNSGVQDILDKFNDILNEHLFSGKLQVNNIHLTISNTPVPPYRLPSID
jgi:hypothetical protein